MKSSEKWKRIAIAEGILLGIAGLLALLGGLYYRNLIWRGAAEEQAGAEQPVYQFWAHFISFSPREPDLWEQAQSKPVFGDFVFDEKSPRGGLRRRPLAEALAEGKKRGSLNLKPDAAALRSPDPAEVEAELSCLDGRFRYRVTATLKDQAPLGELMLDRARTKPVAMEQAGKPLEDPNAQVVYDVTVVLRIEKVYADGYALMHGPFVVISGEEGYSGPGKVPLIEYKLGEAYNRAASPARDAGAGSFPSKDRGKIIPGHLILITVSPLGATGPGKGTPGI